MPEDSPQEGEVWSDHRHQMYHVIDVNAQWVRCISAGGVDDALFPIDNFLGGLRYLATPTRPYRYPITEGSYWRLRPGVARNFGADNEVFTVYEYQDGIVRVVDNDDYDRYRYSLPEEEFRRLFQVDGTLPNDSDPGDDRDERTYMLDEDSEVAEADTPDPDMEVLRVILANIPPGMALERVTRALAPEYQEAVEDMREDGTLVQFSQNGTLLAPWDRIKPPAEPVESPSLWDRLDQDDAVP